MELVMVVVTAVAKMVFMVRLLVVMVMADVMVTP